MFQQGVGSRCWCSSSTPRSCRSGRTGRGCGSGCSCRRRREQRHCRRSSSNRQAPARNTRNRPQGAGNPSKKSVPPPICGGAGCLFFWLSFSPVASAQEQFLGASAPSPLRGVLGVGSRYWCSSSTPRSSRTGRTGRGCGTGSSRRRRREQHHCRRSSSNRQAPARNTRNRPQGAGNPSKKSVPPPICGGAGCLFFWLSFSPVASAQEQFLGASAPSPLRGVLGVGSRCRCSSSTPRSSRSGRTGRGSGTGRSRRRRREQRHCRRSSSNRRYKSFRFR